MKLSPFQERVLVQLGYEGPFSTDAFALVAFGVRRKQTLKSLEDKGLIRWSMGAWRLTPEGKAWFRAYDKAYRERKRIREASDQTKEG